MSNALRGVISHDLDDRRVNLRLSVNEWCELEDELDMDCSAIIEKLFSDVTSGQLSQRFLRRLFRAALSYEAPETTEKAAGEIMASIGMVEAAALLGKVVVASMPQADGGNKKGAETGERKGAKKLNA